MTENQLKQLMPIKRYSIISKSVLTNNLFLYIVNFFYQQMCHGNHSNTLPWHDNKKGDRNSHDQGKLIIKKNYQCVLKFNFVSFRVLQYQPDTCSCSHPTGATEMKRNFHNQRHLTLYTLNYSLTVAYP